MGVVRISKSGNSFQFITDEGVIYQQGLMYLKSALENPAPNKVIRLTRMPFMADPKLFGKSAVYQPDVDMPDAARELAEKNIMNKEIGKVVEQVKAYEDKSVW